MNLIQPFMYILKFFNLIIRILFYFVKKIRKKHRVIELIQMVMLKTHF